MVLIRLPFNFHESQKVIDDFRSRGTTQQCHMSVWNITATSLWVPLKHSMSMVQNSDKVTSNAAVYRVTGLSVDHGRLVELVCNLYGASPILLNEIAVKRENMFF